MIHKDEIKCKNRVLSITKPHDVKINLQLEIPLPAGLEILAGSSKKGSQRQGLLHAVIPDSGPAQPLQIGSAIQRGAQIPGDGTDIGPLAATDGKIQFREFKPADFKGINLHRLRLERHLLPFPRILEGRLPLQLDRRKERRHLLQRAG